MKKINYLFTLLAALMISGNMWATVRTLGTGGDYQSINFLMQEAQDGDVIQLVSDFTEQFNDFVVDGKTLSFELNGFSYSSDYGMTINSNGNLTILNSGAETASINVGIYSEGTLTVNGGQVVSNYPIQNYGTLIVNGGKVKSTAAEAMALWQMGGTATINGGVFEGYEAIQLDGGTLVINDGTFNSTGDNAFYSRTGTATINGGTFNGAWGTLQPEGGNLTINGGTFNAASIADNGSGTLVYGWQKRTRNITVNGGVFYKSDCGGTDRVFYNPGYGTSTCLVKGGEYEIAVTPAAGYQCVNSLLTAGWKRVIKDEASRPALVNYLEGSSTEAFDMTEDVDLTDYSVTVVGEKTINMNGYDVAISRGMIKVNGDLTINNTGAQASFSEAVETLTGAARRTGCAIEVLEGNSLTINGDVKVYGNASGIIARQNAELSISGATIDANYFAAMIVEKGVVANIDNASISSKSSKLVNEKEGGINNTFSYTLRSEGATLTLTNSTVKGVQGAVAIIDNGGLATIKGCDLQAHKTVGAEKDDSYGALYVATNAIVNVWNTKMTSDRANYSAYIGNNDVTTEWGVINLYEGCLLKDKMYIQATKDGEPYSFPSQISTSSVWYSTAATGGFGPVPEGYEYKASSEAGYNWEVTSNATGAESVVGTDVYWHVNPTWNGTEDKVPTKTDIAIVPEGKTVIVCSVAEGDTAVAQQLMIEKGGIVTVRNGAVLKVGKAGLNIADGGQVIVEAGGIVRVGDDGALVMNNEALLIESDGVHAGVFMIAPAGDKYTHPYATVELYTKAKKVSDSKSIWQHFAIPTNGQPESFTNDGSIVDPVNYNGTWIYNWDVTKGEWYKLAGLSELNEPFRGYNLTNKTAAGGVTYTFKGNIIGNGDADLTFLGKGFDFYGNSYTAPISVAKMLEKFESDNSGVEATVYVYDGTSDTYKSVTSVDIELEWAEFNQIASLQGFFLNSRNGATQSGIDYEAAVWNNPQINTGTVLAPARGKAATNYTTARIMVKAGDREDMVTLIEGGNFTAEFDNGADATKHMSEKSFDIFASVEDEQLATVATNNLNNTTLGFNASEETEYTISFTNLNGRTLSLTDMLTNETMTITEGTTYSFTANANSKTSARFVVNNVGTTTGMQSVSTRNGVSKIVEHGQVIIIKNGARYNTIGATVK